MLNCLGYLKILQISNVVEFETIGIAFNSPRTNLEYNLINFQIWSHNLRESKVETVFVFLIVLLPFIPRAVIHQSTKEDTLTVNNRYDSNSIQTVQTRSKPGKLVIKNQKQNLTKIGNFDGEGGVGGFAPRLPLGQKLDKTSIMNIPHFTFMNQGY